MLDAYVFAEILGAAERDLFFVFHGTGGNETQFTGHAQKLVPNAHVIAPRGDVSEHGALRFFNRTGEGVYDMPDLARRTATMAAFIRAHKARLKPRRVIGLGYSNGANILASVLFADGALFDDAILMHPLIPFDPQKLSGTPRVLITAGRRDPICPVTLTQKLADYFGATLEWHDGGHDIRENEISAATRFLTHGAPQ